LVPQIVEQFANEKEPQMYNAKTIANFFDDYGEKEWNRLTATPRDQVSFYIHKHYLEKFIKAGDSVLEAGAGAGRFTIELAKLGAQITVGDISKVQLGLNEKHVKEAGLEDFVNERVQLDITKLKNVSDNSFDAVVCYGGPISYVMNKAELAIAELLRVVKPKGFLFIGVMSLLGVTRSFFESITTVEGYPKILNGINQDEVLVQGLAHAPFKMYRFSELKTLLKKFPCEVVAASAANYISPGRDEFLQTHLQTEELRQMFLAWELDFCAEEGALDGGTHIIVVVQKDQS
jgi:ubiquinone/menaquinone biosynthesis C-methylase UbiE